MKNISIEKLYEKYFKRVYFYTKRIIGNIGTEEDIEECVSDIFFSIWNNINKFDETRGSIDTYINVKTRSMAINYRRKLGKYEKNDFNEEDKYSDVTTEKLVIDKEDEREVLKIIKAFKEPNKTFFYLRYFMNYDIKSIAKLYKISESAVENRLYRCRQKLKKSLREEIG